jgi:hypothetical protein
MHGTCFALGGEPVGVIEAFIRQWAGPAKKPAEFASALECPPHRLIIIETAGKGLSGLNCLGGVHDTRIS